MLFYEMWPTPFDPAAWGIILSYMFFELMLMRYVPGKVFTATVVTHDTSTLLLYLFLHYENPSQVTPSGHKPVYIANGVQCYLITVACILLGGYIDIIQPHVVYDKMGELLSSM